MLCACRLLYAAQAHPVFDEGGGVVMEGLDAIPGTVESYRVSGPLGTDFPRLFHEA